MRLFVGVPLPKDVREKLEAFWSAHERNIDRTRPVAPENYHITLKFIGDVPEDRARRIERTLEQAIPKARFPVRVTGIGGFPSNVAAKVIWAGVQEGFNELVALSQTIDQMLAAEGIPRERKAFHPHVTLARVKRGVADVTVLTRKKPDFGTFEFKEFVLYKSTLTPGGPIYEKLRGYGVSV